MPTWLTTYWPIFVAVVERVVAVLGCAHVVLNKRDTRAAACWAGLILLAPILGSTLYVLFGINRLRRRGGRLQEQMEVALQNIRRRVVQSLPPGTDDPEEPARRRPQLVRLVGALTDRPLLPGNTVEPLVNGDAAYPAMLDAIHHAERTIGLCSYIFADDRVGRQFIDALDAAQQRGVATRVLVDDMGSRFVMRSAVLRMQRRGIPCGRFLPAFARRTVHLGNLRNHRKILLVDGHTAFTGGMNIHEACRLDLKPRRPVHDLHFRVRGPVVTHLAETFAADWLFATEELLISDDWFPVQQADGQTWARGITDGPDEDYQKMLSAILGAINHAIERVDILTPYFLPDDSTLHALNLAALRGVRVRIILPRRSDHRLVQWATQSYYPQVLECGCELHLTPPPFDHAKLLLIDDDWSLIGSTNWDPRSLQLNFEFNIECYDKALNANLTTFVNDRLGRAEHVTAAHVNTRPLPPRLRDSAVRLLTPYL